jgi:hypothetical protein
MKPKKTTAKEAETEDACRVDKEVVGLKWHKTRGLLCAVHPCGIVADVREMYVNESRLQVCAQIEDLRKSTSNGINKVGYDAACLLWESINAAKRRGCAEAAQVLENVDLFIDEFHLKGHTRKTCRERFSPATRPYASKKNTQAAEHTWVYLNQHRCSLKYAQKLAFNLHLLWVAARRNELVFAKKL